MLVGNNAQVLIFQLKKDLHILHSRPGVEEIACPPFHLIINMDNQTENALSFTADTMIKENLECYIYQIESVKQS